MNSFNWTAAILAALIAAVGGLIVLVGGVVVTQSVGNESMLLYFVWISGAMFGFINRFAYTELLNMGGDA